MNNQWFSKIAVWLVIALVLFTVFKSFDHGPGQGQALPYSDFLEQVRNKHIQEVVIQESSSGVEIVATMKGRCSVVGPSVSTRTAGDAAASAAKYRVNCPQSASARSAPISTSQAV